jgi:hypothetical protein
MAKLWCEEWRASSGWKMLTTKPVVNKPESEGGVGLVGLVFIVKAAAGLPHS